MLNFFLYIKYKYFNIVWLKIKFIFMYVYFIFIRFIIKDWNYNIFIFIRTYIIILRHWRIYYPYLIKLKLKYRYYTSCYSRWGKLRTIKIVGIILYLIIFLLMLKRSYLYTKSQFIKYFFIYFILSAYISSFLYYVFSLKFIVFGPIFAFIIFYIKLN